MSAAPTSIELRVDPDRLADSRTNLGALINRYGLVETQFGYQSADPDAGPRCGRCNRLTHLHLWQLVNPGVAEQGGVLDCETT